MEERDTDERVICACGEERRRVFRGGASTPLYTSVYSIARRSTTSVENPDSDQIETFPLFAAKQTLKMFY